MSRTALSWIVALALAGGAARAEEPAAAPQTAPAPPGVPAPAAGDLQETLAGGAQLRDAPELPSATVDVLPRPTQITIVVRRRAPPPEE